MATQRMHRGLVALSASAVAAIYLAGYVRTQPADASLEAAAATEPTTVISAPANTPPSMTPVPTVQPFVRGNRPPTTAPAAPTAGPKPAPTAPPIASRPSTSTSAAAYKDGTFSGQGSSRRGNVWVNVTVQDGRIASVQITRSTLQYPLRDIAALPGEVVQRQTAQVDIVSGATYSSQAFRTAVSQALGQAKA